MDYSKMKNAELEGLLKQRSLPHTGKKAELVSRLQDHDKQTAAGIGATSSKTSTSPAPPPTDASAATATTAVAAGGQQRVAEPVADPAAVPDQQADKASTKTNELSVAVKSDAAIAAPATVSSVQEGAAEAQKPAEPTNFASNLPATDLEAELEKRRARAKKFGIVETDAEAIKSLERMKKFGTTDAGDSAALKAKLDGALPERGQRKRGREDAAADAAREAAKKQRAAGPAPSAPAGGVKSKSTGKGDKGAPSWMSEQDRAAAEKRTTRFAGTAA